MYLHFPYCKHLCNYCDFHKQKLTTRNFQSFHQLLDDSFAKHELFLKDHAYAWGKLETLYFGGGTPSLWGEEGANFINKIFKQYNISMSDNYEWTLEINPGVWDKRGLDAWDALGVNRYSLGIQALDKKMLKDLDRYHSVEDVIILLQELKRRNKSYSVDFMLGLPHSQSCKRDIIAELKEILSFGPNHISLYILTTKGNYILKDALPGDDWIADEYEKMSVFLKQQGFIHYEVSNFARPGFESKHNLKYWRGETVSALGPSATGFLSEVHLRYKWKNHSCDFSLETLSEKDILFEKLYLQLRTRHGIDFGEYFAGNKLQKMQKLAANWQKRGLVSVEADRLSATSKGFLVMDSLLEELFSHDIA